LGQDCNKQTNKQTKASKTKQTGRQTDVNERIYTPNHERDTMLLCIQNA